jgi:hypothetical protein
VYQCVRLSDKGNQGYEIEVKKEENGLTANNPDNNTEFRKRSTEQAAVEQREH